MAASDLMDLLRARFDISFKNPELMGLALTHASKHRDVNNERLEFLGDRILGLVIADALYRTYTDEDEGKLALRHAALVRAEMVATAARDIHLADAIEVSVHDRASGTATLENVLADAFEAMVGAIYIDQGIAACTRLINGLWQPYLDQMVEPPQDPKTGLQEWAQGRGLPLPQYDLVTRDGPDHAPSFTISVSVKDNGMAIASGSSRRLAEKAAAAELLATLKAKKKK